MSSSSLLLFRNGCSGVFDGEQNRLPARRQAHMTDELLQLLQECAHPFDIGDDDVMKAGVLSVTRSFDGQLNVLLRITSNLASASGAAYYITKKNASSVSLERLRLLLLARGHAFEQYQAISKWLSCAASVSAPTTETSCDCPLGNFVHFSICRASDIV